jgi:hypothetical protein
MVSFNEHGIWNKEGVYFSVHGNLVQTINKLVHASQRGYTAKELSHILHVKVDDLLRIQTNKQLLKREKQGRSYIYYSADEEIYTIQRRERQLLSGAAALQNSRLVINNKDVVIAILIEIILSGKICIESIEQQLKAKSLHTNIAEIEVVISHYNLKKTMHKL